MCGLLRTIAVTHEERSRHQVSTHIGPSGRMDSSKKHYVVSHTQINMQAKWNQARDFDGKATYPQDAKRDSLPP